MTLWGWKLSPLCRSHLPGSSGSRREGGLQARDPGTRELPGSELPGFLSDLLYILAWAPGRSEVRKCQWAQMRNSPKESPSYVAWGKDAQCGRSPLLTPFWFFFKLMTTWYEVKESLLKNPGCGGSSLQCTVFSCGSRVCGLSICCAQAQ